MGAMPSLPLLQEVISLLQERKCTEVPLSALEGLQ
jgi:hypothetical protein